MCSLLSYLLLSIGFIEPKWMQFTIRSPQIGDSDETVYEDLCYVKIPLQVNTLLYSLSMCCSYRNVLACFSLVLSSMSLLMFSLEYVGIVPVT